MRQRRTSRIPPVNKAAVTLRWTLRGEDRRDSGVFLAQEISSDKNSAGRTKLRRTVSVKTCSLVQPMRNPREDPDTPHLCN